MKHSIRLSKSVIGSEEIEAVTAVLNKEFLGMGEEVFKFENEHDLTIDLEDAKKRLTINTKAIMPIHYSGNPGDLDDIYSFARENNLRVIEDAAHAFGSLYKKKLIGSFGDICCFSFDGIKNITSGEGGSIITRDQSVIDRVKDLRLLGVSKDSDNRYKNQRTWDFNVSTQGWRYHMSNIMAAIGIEQLKKFDSFQKKRKTIAKLYQELLSEVDGIELLPINYDNITPHIFAIKVKNEKRDLLKKYLEVDNIQTGLHYKPNHLHDFYSSDKLPLTEKIFLELLTLPLHPDLSEKDVRFICDKIKFIL